MATTVFSVKAFLQGKEGKVWANLAVLETQEGVAMDDAHTLSHYYPLGTLNERPRIVLRQARPADDLKPPTAIQQQLASNMRRSYSKRSLI